VRSGEATLQFESRRPGNADTPIVTVRYVLVVDQQAVTV
jgi:hypothetical protein